MRALFAQYVPAGVADQLVASGRGQTASEGERLAVTALFCDLRGFSAFAETVEPEHALPTAGQVVGRCPADLAGPEDDDFQVSWAVWGCGAIARTDRGR